MSFLIERKAYEDEIRNGTRNMFKTADRQEQFIKEVCDFLFGQSDLAVDKIEDLEEMISKSSPSMGLLWNPSKDLKCATCVVGVAALAAAIVATVVASGGANVYLMGVLIAQYGVSEAVAAAAVSGASAGVIAVLLCPDCKK